MGEPVSVVQKPSAIHGRVRFETNRSFTGMGHERYKIDEVIYGERPPDVVAKLLLDSGKVDAVHVYQHTITVELAPGADASGLKEIIESLYTHYKPGVPVPDPDNFAG